MTKVPRTPPVGAEPGGFDAHLDPWCDIVLINGDSVLFGFSLSHPVTMGLGWLVSTAVREFDPRASRAVTESGRRYRLGRRIRPADIRNESEEAWVAFDLLIGDEAENGGAVPPAGADPARDTRWVAACKAARHLGLAPPRRAASEVEAFLRAHLDAYLRLREKAGLM